MEILLSINENLHPQGQAGGREGHLKNKTKQKMQKCMKADGLMSLIIQVIKTNKVRMGGLRKQKRNNPWVVMGNHGISTNISNTFPEITQF